MRYQFEADLDPGSLSPRIRFNFANGWSGSLVMRGPMSDTGCDTMLASVAACPSGRWQTGVTELGPTEAFADEAVAWLQAVSQRPSPSPDTGA
jgi:hypothetical protein